jgi:glycosyltransferase involved in cell wall biosynthesis
MERVQESMLAPAIARACVIPHGVDLNVFKPASRQEARTAVGLSSKGIVVLTPAGAWGGGEWMDCITWRAAAVRIAERISEQETLLFIGLGKRAKTLQVGRATVRFVPYQTDPRLVAMYHQAADVYVHPAMVDTFPSMVLEALACGTPVVATKVGGIPEQVLSLGVDACSDTCAKPGEPATGVLVTQGDSEGMANAVITLLRNVNLRRQLSDNAVRHARRGFDLRCQFDAYEGFYAATLKDWDLARIPPAPRTV